jgi:DNA-binding PucR family transcriptional regulator
MKTGIKCEPDKKIYRFFDFAVEFLVSIYLNSNKPVAFCHPDVLVLYKYDKQHGTEYLKTITAMYTFSGKLTLAAKALHLHRNSLMYRIDRIKEILGIDAYDENFPLYFLLSSHIMQFASE